YEVAFIKNRILFESLDYYPSRVKANLFTRDESDTWETIKFGGVPDINYLKVASFISGDISLVMPDIDVKELSDGFFEEFDG
ncbi:ATP-binding protein, partial [Enterobacter kobei]|nr:ATP-binding protein [Enterobacter kobei]